MLHCLLTLLLLAHSTQGLWVTLPSAQDGCGSFSSDSYSWDIQDSPKQPFSGTVPKGGYSYYYTNCFLGFLFCDTYYSTIVQSFCTMNVDQMPLGSYCFYQNIQNCIHLFHSFFPNN